MLDNEKTSTTRSLEGNMALDPLIINTEDIGDVPASQFSSLAEEMRSAILGDVGRQVDVRGLDERMVRSLVGNKVADLLLDV